MSVAQTSIALTHWDGCSGERNRFKRRKGVDTFLSLSHEFQYVRHRKVLYGRGRGRANHSADVGSSEREVGWHERESLSVVETPEAVVSLCPLIGFRSTHMEKCPNP